MDTISIVSTTISGIIAILSIILSIVTFAKKSSASSNKLEARLTGMEKDILYIRETLDENKARETDLEKRIERLERKSK